MKVLFGPQHHNAIAKEFRENWPFLTSETAISMGVPLATVKIENMVSGTVLTNLAISIATRFKRDNPKFDPVKFLNACSPNELLLPLGELWDDSFLDDKEG